MRIPVDTNLFVLTSGYGNRPQFGDFHTGTDWAPKSGQPTPFWSIADGVVEYVGLSAKFKWQGQDKQNSVIIINHGNGLKSQYVHWPKAYVSVGQKVTEGFILGLTGSVGAATGNHLHNELWVDGRSVDSIEYINNHNQMTNDQEFITVQTGWGLSNVAVAAGLPATEETYQYLAQLNNVARENFRLYPDQMIRVKPEIVKPTDVATQLNDLLEKEKKESQAKLDEANALIAQSKVKEAALKEALEKMQTQLEEVKNKIVVPEVTEEPQITFDFSKVEFSEIEKEGVKYLYSEFCKWFTKYWNKMPKNLRILLTVILAGAANIGGVYLAQNQLPGIETQYFVMSSTVLTSLVIRLFQGITKIGERELAQELYV